MGRDPIFYVEAKKPSVNLKLDSAPAFQLRRYAWNTKLPLSILTDFEEFAVYDCRARPLKNDKATTERTLYVGYQEYAQKWDEIAAIFGREAVLRGSLEQYADATRSRRGYIEVDDAFLAEIEHWCDLLARNLALRNPQLSQGELNFAVQMTIDRLIFLRICEDRGIEPFMQLKDQIGGSGVYAKLCHLFQRADARYNSGLFHFTAEKGQSEAPDGFTLGLEIDDKPLKEIIGSVYDSSYDFSVMPADILVLPEYSRSYVMGLLNSKLLEWFVHQIATQMRGGYYSYESRFIRWLPIVVASPESPESLKIWVFRDQREKSRIFGV